MHNLKYSKVNLNPIKFQFRTDFNIYVSFDSFGSSKLSFPEDLAYVFTR